MSDYNWLEPCANCGCVRGDSVHSLLGACRFRSPPAAVAPPSAPKQTVRLPGHTYADDDWQEGTRAQHAAVAPPETTAPTATQEDDAMLRGLAEHHYGATRELLQRTMARLACDCGAPVAASCVTCVVGDYQAAHPDCATCCYAPASISFSAPVASSATPEVTLTPVRVPHLPQIESSAASSATPTPEPTTPLPGGELCECGEKRCYHFGRSEWCRDADDSDRFRGTGKWAPLPPPTPLQVAEAALASSQQEVERLTAANAGLAAMVEELSEALAADPARYEAFMRSKEGK